MAARTDKGYLGAKARRFMRRFEKRNESKAIFALAHRLIVVIWHLLADDCDYSDLGADFFDRRDNDQARTRALVSQLERLGHTVILQPAAA